MIHWSQGDKQSPWLQSGYGLERIASHDDGTWQQMTHNDPENNNYGLFVGCVPYGYDQYRFSGYYKWTESGYDTLDKSVCPWVLPAVVRWHGPHEDHPSEELDNVDLNDHIFGPPVHIAPNSGAWPDDVWDDTWPESNDGMRWLNCSRLGLEHLTERDSDQLAETEEAIDFLPPQDWCFVALPWQVVPISEEAYLEIYAQIRSTSQKLGTTALAYSDNALNHLAENCTCRGGCDRRSVWSADSFDTWRPCHCDYIDIDDDYGTGSVRECQLEGENHCACSWSLGDLYCSCGEKPLIPQRKEGLMDASSYISGSLFIPPDYQELWAYAVNRFVDGWQSIFDCWSTASKEEKSWFTSSWRQASPYSASYLPETHRQALLLHSTSSVSLPAFSVAS